MSGKIGLEKEFGSIRMITTLVPDTFMRKLIIISTIFSNSSKLGETAVKQEMCLNMLFADYNQGFTKVIKKHSSLKEAIKFHNSFVKKQKFTDCEFENLGKPSGKGGE